MESNGMRDFLQTLPEEEVHGLLKTTTAGLISALTVEDAIPTIILYSDAVTLLNRRRVKKEYLINYLLKNKVRFPFTADKTKLCRMVLNLWGEKNCEALKFVDLPISKESKLKNIQNQNPCTTSLEKPTLEPKCKPIQKPIIIPESKIQESSISQQIVAVNNSVVEEAEDEAMEYEESISLRRQEIQCGQQLGEQFTKWFYGNLNDLSDFGPHHFWPQCSFRIEYLRNSAFESKNVKEIVHDGHKCFTEMCELRNIQQIYFNPNLIPGVGVRGKINPHGLAQVVACGTVLKLGDVLGVFEQVFGLMMDPEAGNNYKIKYSMLRLREGNYIMKSDDPPGLCDSSLIGIIEEVDDD